MRWKKQLSNIWILSLVNKQINNQMKEEKFNKELGFRYNMRLLIKPGMKATDIEECINFFSGDVNSENRVIIDYLFPEDLQIIDKALIDHFKDSGFNPYMTPITKDCTWFQIEIPSGAKIQFRSFVHYENADKQTK